MVLRAAARIASALDLCSVLARLCCSAEMAVASLLWLCRRKGPEEANGVIAEAAMVFYGEGPGHTVAVALLLSLGGDD